MNPIAYLITATASFLKELAISAALSYRDIVVRASLYFLAVLLFAVTIGAGGYALNLGFFVSFGVLLAGVVISAWILVLLPALLIVIEADQRVTSINKVFTAALFVFFNTLVLSTFIYVSGVWQYPRVFGPLAFAFAAFMVIGVLGGSTSREILSARARTSVIVLAALVALSPLVPGRLVSGLIDIKATLDVAAPRQILYTPDMRFFDERSGDPVVWYGVNDSGAYDLFDNRGHHPATGEELLPITRDVVRQVREHAAQTQGATQPPPQPAVVNVQNKPSSPLQVPVVTPPEANTNTPVEQPQPVEESVVVQTTAKATTAAVLATDTSRVGDRIGATLVEPVRLGNHMLPKGTEVQLQVREFSAETNDNPAYIEIIPVGASFGATRLALQGEPLRISPQRRSGNAFLRALGGAAAGAVVGGLVGGKEGAATGAAIGGGAAVALTLIMRGRNMEVPVGYPVELVLTEITPRTPIR